jgi:hypothetical protein
MVNERNVSRKVVLGPRHGTQISNSNHAPHVLAVPLQFLQICQSKCLCLPTDARIY